jgi:hypothetical protein
MGLNMKLLNLSENPIKFFENIKDRNWKHAFKFFLNPHIIIFNNFFTFLSLNLWVVKAQY